MNYLVVEDEAYVAEILRRALEELGNTCVLAHDADEASEYLDQQQFDALTVDLGMPGRGGLDWLESVAESRPELAQKTLVITGQLLEAEAVERLAACGAGILAKPFTLDTLEDALRSQVDRPTAHRRN